MADPFVAEIRIFAGNFAPRDWAYCDGQLIPIQQNPALFSLLGTIYGGNGRTNFALPDLRGRAPMQPGSGPGLTTRSIGQRVGDSEVMLSGTQLPGHTHAVYGSSGERNTETPVDNAWGSDEAGDAYRDSPNVSMSNSVLDPVGGGQAHNNMQPFIAMYFIICLVGVYPASE